MISQAANVTPENVGRVWKTYPLFKLMPVSEYVDVLLKEVGRILQEGDKYSDTVNQIEGNIGKSISLITCDA